MSRHSQMILDTLRQERLQTNDAPLAWPEALPLQRQFQTLNADEFKAQYLCDFSVHKHSEEAQMSKPTDNAAPKGVFINAERWRALCAQLQKEGSTQAADTVGIPGEYTDKAASLLSAVSEYCQKNNIGKWGDSATAELVRDHERLMRENASLRNSLESVVDGRAAILALVRGEDVACDGWLVELEGALKERLHAAHLSATASACGLVLGAIKESDDPAAVIRAAKAFLESMKDDR